MKSDQWVLLDILEDGSIEPHSRHDRERIRKRAERARPDGRGRRLIRASLANVRSLPQLRLYWPWVRKVADNSPHFTSERPLHNLLLTACGVTEPMIDLEGNIQMIPSSIAFDAMGDEEFTLYFERAQQVVGENILPGVSLKALMKEAREECSWPEQEAA